MISWLRERRIFFCACIVFCFSMPLFLLDYLETFFDTLFVFFYMVSSLPHPRRNPGPFCLAVTLGAIFAFSVFQSFLSFGTMGFILFSTISFFSCAHLFLPSLSGFHENNPLVNWELLLWKFAVDIVVLCLWFPALESLEMYLEDLLEEYKLGQKSFCRVFVPYA